VPDIERTNRPSRGAFSYYGETLRRRPLGASLGLVVEYLTFAAAVFLACGLYVTRVPLRFVDRVTGLRIRERVLAFLAWASPG
jgi:hypothetical protein